MTTMYVEPTGCRMEDKQTKFQLSPIGHMKAQGFEVTPEQQDLLVRADTVVEVYQALCRAVILQESTDKMFHALEGLLADKEDADGEPEAQQDAEES